MINNEKDLSDKSVSQSREIKFRAWDGNNLCDVWAWNDKERLTSKGKPSHTVNNDFGDKWIYGIESNDIILMQYTGLKDKNGVEIYEGDIVIDTNKSHSDYNNKRIVSISPTKGTTLNDISLGDRAWKWYEIIGNVYQNPELLSDI